MRYAVPAAKPPAAMPNRIFLYFISSAVILLYADNSIYRTVNDIHMMVNLVYTRTTLPHCFCHQPSHYNSVTGLIEAGKQIWKPLSLSLQLLGYTPYPTDGLSSSIGMERYPRSRTPISGSKSLAIHLIPGLATYNPL